jgi:hypothetical protein
MMLASAWHLSSTRHPRWQNKRPMTGNLQPPTRHPPHQPCNRTPRDALRLPTPNKQLILFGGAALVITTALRPRLVAKGAYISLGVRAHIVVTPYTAVGTTLLPCSHPHALLLLGWCRLWCHQIRSMDQGRRHDQAQNYGGCLK